MIVTEIKIKQYLFKYVAFSVLGTLWRCKRFPTWSHKYAWQVTPVNCSPALNFVSYWNYELSTYSEHKIRSDT